MASGEMKPLRWVTSILLGLAGGSTICALTYLNDWVMRNTYMVGNNLPVSVFGGLVLFVLLINTLLVRISRHLGLNGPQLAVTVVLCLSVCCIPGSGLMRTFPSSIIMPHHWEQSFPGWQKARVLDMAPPNSLVDVNPGPDSRELQAAIEQPPTDEASPSAPREIVVPDGVQYWRRLDLPGGVSLRANDGVVIRPPQPESAAVRRGAEGPDSGLEFTALATVNQQLAEARTAGGGVVALPAGRYRGEALELAPDLTLRFQEGAEFPGVPTKDRVLTEYVQGDSKSAPWRAWLPAATFWLPIILTFWLCLIGLALVVTRQWSQHEHLPYPVANFAASLLPDAPGNAMGKVLRNKLFWIGFAVVLGIYLNNYAVILSGAWTQIPTSFRLSPIVDLVPQLSSAWWLRNATIYFTVVAFAYFLATDVSFSMGSGPIFYTFMSAVLGGYGISMTGGGSASPEVFILFGAYVGTAAVVFFTGRHYYLSAAKGAVGMKTNEKLPAATIWGARLFALSFGAFAALLARAGVDWQLAILYAAGAVLTFLVMSRIIAETGLFFIQAYWFPCGVLVGVLGPRALGPETMLALFIFSMVLLIDPREALMPFMVNNFKILETKRIDGLKLLPAIVLAIVVGLGIAGFATVTIQYRDNTKMSDQWATRVVPQKPFKDTVNYTQRLQAQKELATSRQVSGFARFAKARPQDSSILVAFVVGLGLVLAFSALRLRFTWWPIHPAMFCIWATFPARMFAFSFLVGWVLKVLVMKYGGARVYQNVKPLMFGLIAGEMVGALVPALIGFIYYAYTGRPLDALKIMPG